MPEPVDIARGIAEIASDILASNISVMDISGLSVIADYFIICSADNVRQLNALRDTIARQMTDRGVKHRRVEGTAETGWILMDYGDVVAHLFSVDQREFYRLDDVWSEAPRLLVIQ